MFHGWLYGKYTTEGAVMGPVSNGQLETVLCRNDIMKNDEDQLLQKTDQQATSSTARLIGPAYFVFITRRCLQSTRIRSNFGVIDMTKSLTVITYTVWVKKSPGVFFLTFLPKRLGIFNTKFTRLLCVPIYAGLQIFIQLSATLTIEVITGWTVVQALC